jgi:Na+-transporting NADH:ubiquinone oxidoreductase subunit A
MLKHNSSSRNCKKSIYNKPHRALFLLLGILFSSNLYAQDGGGFLDGNTNRLVLFLLIGTLSIILIGILFFTDRLLKVTAEKVRSDIGKPELDEEEDEGYSVLPSYNEIFPSQKSVHPYAGSETIIKTEKGMDIRIKGRSKKVVKNDFVSETYAINPKDFVGLKPIPKLHVSEGDEVKAGDPLFFDKSRPDVNYTSPVSGEVIEIRRGAKRAI